MWLFVFLIVCFDAIIITGAFSSKSLKPQGRPSYPLSSTTPDVNPTTSLIDPLLTNTLIAASAASTSVGGLTLASNGIKVWRQSLTKGKLPVGVDFESFNADDEQPIWPVEPLFTGVCDRMAKIQLPRLTLCHPETITPVLLSLIRITMEYTEEVRQAYEEQEEEQYTEEQYDNDNCSIGQDYDVAEGLEIIPTYQELQVSTDEIANKVSEILLEEWDGVVSGVHVLDQLFGLDHGMLLTEEDSSQSGPSGGFGRQDGVWQHTGWREIPALQDQISFMPELKDLLKTLGRRPTAENADRINKFAPRKRQLDGGLGAEFDPQERDSVSGVTLSGSFSEMLPSEAMLLRGSSPALRRLFMAKKLENKLLSYELSGWKDVPSVPLTRPLYMKRLPSAPGGPIIVCLDTSFSMCGMREQLSKAVVLACVSEAFKQGRDCQVVAFSTERGTVEAGAIPADALGIRRLLDFLSHSFGGGTDVTGALKHAMTSLDTDVMSAADILLISDGEIPDPPISIELMEELDRLKLKKEVQVHGLLVGKSESKPMSRLCNKIHDFLTGYDSLASIGASYRGYSTAAGCMPSKHVASNHRISTSARARAFFSSRGLHMEMRRGASPVLAKRSRYDEDGSGKRSRKKEKKKKWEDEGYFDDGFEDIPEEQVERQQPHLNDNGSSNFLDEVEEATQALKRAAEKVVLAASWDNNELSKERSSHLSCWKHQEKLQAAVQRVGEGLVEREEESRLVVLSMMANEHILLLGVPGTGKSILGRRLAKLCSGSFFQRLLTRFTTPDELFGPLSLKSLENDEYRRVTAGFLPDASVAFLDEIFKANSAILNTLLTILNERKFDNAGGQEDCPIRCVVGASNELPESDELVALFDRFLIRKEVHPLSDEGALKLLSMPNPGASPCDDDKDGEACDVIFAGDFQEVVKALEDAADSVQMGDHICKLMVDLRTFMKEEQNVEISDRRLVKASRLLKISAASNGRSMVDTIDCLLLQHCMWQLPEQKKAVKEWLWDNLTPGGGSTNQFRFLLESLRQEILTAVRRTGGDVNSEYGARESDLAVIQSLRTETNQMVSILLKQQANLARHTELLGRSMDFLWLNPEESLSVRQILLPRAEIFASELRDTLIDAQALEISVSADAPDAPSAELRLSAIEQLWEEGYSPDVNFTDDELNIGMKEAKAKYDLDTFRKWKRARKRARQS